MSVRQPTSSSAPSSTMRLNSLGVLGDQHLFRILEIGTLKRLCAKLSVPMLMFSEQERAQGTELNLLSLKADLKAYADKEFLGVS